MQGMRAMAVARWNSHMKAVSMAKMEVRIALGRQGGGLGRVMAKVVLASNALAWLRDSAKGWQFHGVYGVLQNAKLDTV